MPLQKIKGIDACRWAGVSRRFRGGGRDAGGKVRRPRVPMSEQGEKQKSDGVITFYIADGKVNGWKEE